MPLSRCEPPAAGPPPLSSALRREVFQEERDDHPRRLFWQPVAGSFEDLEPVGSINESRRPRGSVAPQRRVLATPDIERGYGDAARRDGEIVVDRPIPVQGGGQSPRFRQPPDVLAHKVLRYPAEVRGSQAGGMIRQQGPLRGTVRAPEEADVVEPMILIRILSGRLLQGDR